MNNVMVSGDAILGVENALARPPSWALLTQVLCAPLLATSRDKGCTMKNFMKYFTPKNLIKFHMTIDTPIDMLPVYKRDRFVSVVLRFRSHIEVKQHRTMFIFVV